MSAQISFFEERAERDRRLQYFLEHHDEYLRGVREFAKDFARAHGSVAIDDVRCELERHGHPLPSEIGIDARVFGAVFKSSQFRAIGQRPTHRGERIARSGRGASFVTVYVLNNESGPVAQTKAAS